MDALTGFTWQQRSGLSGGISWKDALASCESLDYAGYDDWRLPNVSELLSLVDEKKDVPPAINTVYFAGLQTQSGFLDVHNVAYHLLCGLCGLLQ